MERRDPQVVKYFLIRSLVSPFTFIISVGISFIDVQAAQYFWIVILPAYVIVNKIHLQGLFNCKDASSTLGVVKKQSILINLS